MRFFLNQCERERGLCFVRVQCERMAVLGPVVYKTVELPYPATRTTPPSISWSAGSPSPSPASIPRALSPRGPADTAAAISAVLLVVVVVLGIL